MKTILAILILLTATTAQAVNDQPQVGMSTSKVDYWRQHFNLTVQFAAGLAASGNYAGDVDSLTDQAYRMTESVYKKYNVQIVEPAPISNLNPDGSVKKGPARDFNPRINVSH